MPDDKILGIKRVIGVAVAGYILRPRPKKRNETDNEGRPFTIDTIDFLPIIYGTVQVNDSPIGYYARSIASSDNQPYMSSIYVLARYCQDVVRIEVDNTQYLSHTINRDSSNLTNDKEYSWEWNGYSGEGVFKPNRSNATGSSLTNPETYIQSYIAGNVVTASQTDDFNGYSHPRELIKAQNQVYRDCAIFATSQNYSTSKHKDAIKQPLTIKFLLENIPVFDSRYDLIISRVPNEIADNEENLLSRGLSFHSANPASVIYDVLVNIAGVATTQIHTASFTSVAAYLHTRSMGMCTYEKNQLSAEDFVTNVGSEFGVNLIYNDDSDQFHLINFAEVRARSTTTLIGIDYLLEVTSVSGIGYEETPSGYIFTAQLVENGLDEYAVLRENIAYNLVPGAVTLNNIETVATDYIRTKDAFENYIAIHLNNAALPQIEISFRIRRGLNLELGDLIRLDQAPYDGYYLNITRIDYGTLEDNEIGITAIQAPLAEIEPVIVSNPNTVAAYSGVDERPKNPILMNPNRFMINTMYGLNETVRFVDETINTEITNAAYGLNYGFLMYINPSETYTDKTSIFIVYTNNAYNAGLTLYTFDPQYQYSDFGTIGETFYKRLVITSRPVPATETTSALTAFYPQRLTGYTYASTLSGDGQIKIETSGTNLLVHVTINDEDGTDQGTFLGSLTTSTNTRFHIENTTGELRAFICSISSSTTGTEDSQSVRTFTVTRDTSFGISSQATDPDYNSATNYSVFLAGDLQLGVYDTVTITEANASGLLGETGGITYWTDVNRRNVCLIESSSTVREYINFRYRSNTRLYGIERGLFETPAVAHAIGATIMLLSTGKGIANAYAAANQRGYFAAGADFEDRYVYVGGAQQELDISSYSSISNIQFETGLTHPVGIRFSLGTPATTSYSYATALYATVGRHRSGTRFNSIATFGTAETGWFNAYPPSQVTVNGLIHNSANISGSSTITIAWTHKPHIADYIYLTGQTATETTSGTFTKTVRIMNGNTAIRTLTAQSSTGSYSWTTTTQESDLGDDHDDDTDLTVEVETVWVATVSGTNYTRTSSPFTVSFTRTGS